MISSAAIFLTYSVKHGCVGNIVVSAQGPRQHVDDQELDVVPFLSSLLSLT